MFCTTIIPTVGRDTLAQTVYSALAQNLPLDDHEIVVVNNSGKPLPPADWQSNPQVRVVDINRVPGYLSHNIGAAVARGEWIKYLHDDDYLLPGGLRQLLDVASTTDCDIVYSGVRYVDWNDKWMYDQMAEVKGDMFFLLLDGDCLHLSQTVIRRQAFLEAGGLGRQDPRDDLEVEVNMTFKSQVACTDGIAVAIRKDPRMSTGKWEKLTVTTRKIREMGLDMSGSLNRMVSGPYHTHAVNGGIASTQFLLGRSARVYAKSMMESLRTLRPRRFLKRFACMVLIGLPGLLSGDFWRGLRGIMPAPQPAANPARPALDLNLSETTQNRA